MNARLEILVREWRDAQKAIDRQIKLGEFVGAKEQTEGIQRLFDAHAALIKYADEEI